MPETMIERMTAAIREETVRQYRDHDREKCPAGAAYYEEEIAPYQIARAALAAMREPTDAMMAIVIPRPDYWPPEGQNAVKDKIIANHRRDMAMHCAALIDAALAEGAPVTP